MKAKDVIRLWSKVPIGANGCWEWTAGRFNTGYGAFWIEKGLRGAHRAVYESLYGPIPEGLHVLHHCDNPPCVNPLHLHLGTPAVNMRERDERGRHHSPPPKTHCVRGHELTPENLRTEKSGRQRCAVCCKIRTRESWRRRHGKDIKYRAH